MSDFLHWLLFAALALLAVAVIVAWWEHLGRRGQLPDGIAEGMPARTISVDVLLEAAAPDAAPQPSGTDTPARREPGVGVRSAPAAAAGRPARSAWTETAPMIGPGPPITPSAPRTRSMQGADSTFRH